MGFLDSSGPPTKHKYHVKHCDEPLPFGKLKGHTLREIHDIGNEGDYFRWCFNNGLFGCEDFWGTEIREIYKNILEDSENINYSKDDYWDFLDDYEMDYWGTF